MNFMKWIEGAILEEHWQRALEGEFEKSYMKDLRGFLRAEKDQKKVVYPKSEHIFNAFTLTPFNEIKVVILGQDPYHGPGQAHGLCFSVQTGVKLPPSLINIYKELNKDLGISISQNGCLEHWAKQGVLLLNSVLTVEKGLAASHQGKGWELFTDQVITLLNEQKEGLVFLLWGAYAQRKGQYIDVDRHAVLKAPHPSPFSAHQGFLGCQHFSKTNAYLLAQGKKPIDWQIQS